MKAAKPFPLVRNLAAAALCMMASGALAAPIKIEAVIAPKSQSRLDFADGSKRYWLATQREGKATGNGPLAGATMVEWGVHDVDPASGADANGYLVFTTAQGDVAYLKVPVPRRTGSRPRRQGALRRERLLGGRGRHREAEGLARCGNRAVPAERAALDPEWRARRRRLRSAG